MLCVQFHRRAPCWSQEQVSVTCSELQPQHQCCKGIFLCRQSVCKCIKIKARTPTCCHKCIHRYIPNYSSCLCLQMTSCQLGSYAACWQCMHKSHWLCMHSQRAQKPHHTVISMTKAPSLQHRNFQCVERLDSIVYSYLATQYILRRCTC